MSPLHHTSSPYEPFPSAEMLSRATNTYRQRNFDISSRKLPISKSAPIEGMSKRLGIPVPEMIFGENLVAIRHAPSGWAIEFTAEAALEQVDKTGANMLQVAYAGAWSYSREHSSAHNIKEVVRPYDWSYSTTYRGTERPALHGLQAGRRLEPPPGRRRRSSSSSSSSSNNRQIPLELLKRRDPILFFDDVVLFESELDDNGISLLSCKVRVMEQRMLLLCRLYMRLDSVVVRVRDTRVYVDFDTDDVIREYTAKEDSYESLTKTLRLSGLGPDALTAALRDPNQVAHLLPVVDQHTETVMLSARCRPHTHTPALPSLRAPSPAQDHTAAAAEQDMNCPDGQEKDCPSLVQPR